MVSLKWWSVRGIRALIVVGVVALSACDRNVEATDRAPSLAAGDSPQTTAQLFDEKAFAAYTSRLRIDIGDSQASARAREEFEKRERLVQAILAGKTVDPAALEAELGELRRELIVKTYFAEFLAAKAADEKVREYAKSNATVLGSFKARIAQIVVKLPAQPSDASYAKVTELEQRLASNEPFEKLARDLSDDAASAMRGGDLGWVQSDALPTQVSATIRALKLGQTTSPIATREGVVIVKMLSDPVTLKNSGDSSLAAARAQLRVAEREKEIARLLATTGYVEPAD